MRLRPSILGATQIDGESLNDVADLCDGLRAVHVTAPSIAFVVNDFNQSPRQARSLLEEQAAPLAFVTTTRVRGSKAFFWRSALGHNVTAGFDYVWVFDGDMDVSPRYFSLAHVIAVLEATGSPLLQPLVLPASPGGFATNHAELQPALVGAASCMVRPTLFVEVQAPFFRGEVWARFHAEVLLALPEHLLFGCDWLDAVWCRFAELLTSRHCLVTRGTFLVHRDARSTRNGSSLRRTGCLRQKSALGRLFAKPSRCPPFWFDTARGHVSVSEAAAMPDASLLMQPAGYPFDYVRRVVHNFTSPCISIEGTPPAPPPLSPIDWAGQATCNDDRAAAAAARPSRPEQQRRTRGEVEASGSPAPSPRRWEDAAHASTSFSFAGNLFLDAIVAPSQEDEARPAIFLFSPELRATPPEGAVCRFEGRVASPLRLVRSTGRRDGQDSAGEASFSSPNEHPVRLAWTCAFPEWPTTPARLPASVGMSLEAKGVVRAAITVATWPWTSRESRYDVAVTCMVKRVGCGPMLDSRGGCFRDWLAWHRAVGVGHFLLYANAPEGSWVEVAARADDVTLVNWPWWVKGGFKDNVKVHLASFAKPATLGRSSRLSAVGAARATQPRDLRLLPPRALARLL